VSLYEKLLFRNMPKPEEPILKTGRDYWILDKGRGSSYNMLLTPENFNEWYSTVKERGRAWISVCYYTVETDSKMNLICRPSTFDTVVYDFDIPLPKEQCIRLREEDPDRFNSLLEKVRIEALRLYWHLSNRFNCTPMLVFTGNRGYQVWLLLEKALPAIYYKMAFRYYLTGLTFDKELDTQTADQARLIRVPYTRHEHGGLAVPLNPKTLKPLKLEEVVSELKPATTQTLEELIGIEPLEIPKPISIGVKRGSKIRPCIASALKQPLHGGSGHLMRLAIAVEYLSMGYHVDQIVELFKSQPDFSEKLTRYYIEHAKKKGYKPFKCMTIRRLGYCLSECPIGKKEV